MRKAPKRFFSHDAKGMIPRMSWSSHNLYNIIARTTVTENARKINFRQTQSTMYQQRWTSKKFLRGYHGEWIGEKRFKRWYLPRNIPSLEPIRRDEASRSNRNLPEEEHMPISVLFLRDVERRLDTVVFRCCFARSVREARNFILAGKVTVNGHLQKVCGTLLEPGDLLTVQPKIIPMLTSSVAKEVARRKAIEESQREDKKAAAEASAAEGGKQEAASEGGVEATTEGGEEAVVETSGSEAKAESGETSQGSNESQATTEASETTQEDASASPAGASKDSVAEYNKAKEKQRREHREKPAEVLPPGVLPFNLPPFAAPHLFVPPYLEVSYTTCSAIYIRHPTITAAPQQQGRDRSAPRTMYRSDIPSPYSAASEMFSLAWEFYARNSPRIRSDARRLRQEARVGRNGIASARARDQWRKLVAIRKKKDRSAILNAPANRRPVGQVTQSQFVVPKRTRLAVRPSRPRSPLREVPIAPRRGSASSSSARF